MAFTGTWRRNALRKSLQLNHGHYPKKEKKKSANKYIHGGHVGNNRKDKAGILVLSLNANEMHGQFCRLTLYF